MIILIVEDLETEIMASSRISMYSVVKNLLSLQLSNIWKIFMRKGWHDEQDNLFTKFANTRKLCWDHTWYIFCRLDLAEKMTRHVDKLN